MRKIRCRTCRSSLRGLDGKGRGLFYRQAAASGVSEPIHFRFLLLLEPTHDPVEGCVPSLVHAVAVVQLPGAIDGEPDEEIVGGEEFAPGVVEQDAVGGDHDPALWIFLP